MTESTGTWCQLEIDGKPADVYQPGKPTDSGRVVLFLEEEQGPRLRSSATFSAAFERHGLRVLSPHGSHSWWTNVVCPAFDESISPLCYVREQVIPYIHRQWSSGPAEIGLMGIGLGAQGVLQLAYRFPREFPVVAAIAPAVDFHNWYGRGLSLDGMFPSREAARQQTVVLYLHPLNWPRHQLLLCDPADEDWHEGAERLAMKLSASGVPFEADLTTSQGGHCWEYFDAVSSLAVDFVAERLAQEGLRE
jgi:S-formylglutathione hydrolase